jgi:CotS family spore coat protein
MNDRALRVLEQYDLEVGSMRRGRGAYILETSEGLLSFCDYGGSERRAQFQNRVTQQIRDGGYPHVDVILPNKEGMLVTKDWDEQSYVVKQWYPGRECDSGSESEILTAVRNLARLHRVMHVKGEQDLEKSFQAPTPLEEIRSRNQELKKVRTFLQRKNSKCEFERLLQNSFPVYFEQAQEVQHQLEQNDCANLVSASREDGSICHGDYDYHHVLLAGQEIATIGFERCRYDLQINDLYRYMRKILEKHDWDVRLGMHMLEQYTSIRNISGEERRLLYLRMMYPEKFRKLANSYLGSSKAWISRRFLDKLEQQNRQQEARERFVRALR